MKPLYTIIATILFAIAPSYAFTLQGFVTTTTDNTPLAGCSVVLYTAGNDSVPVTGTSSNEAGYYSLQADGGEYLLRYTFIGMDTVVRPLSLHSDVVCDTVALSPNAVMKEEVTVTARFIEHKDTRINVKIAGNPLAQNATGLDMLYRIPGTWGLSIYGRNIAKIYVNGSELRISPDGWRNYLQSLDASMIESYELETMAGSEIEGSANGSILYINLIKAPEAGAKITIGLEEGYYFGQNFPDTDPSLNMAIGYKNFQSYTTFRYINYGSRKANATSRRFYFNENNDTTRYFQESTSDQDTETFILNQSFSYRFDNRNQLEFNLAGLFTPTNNSWANRQNTYNNTGLVFPEANNDTTKTKSHQLIAYIAHIHQLDTIGSSMKASVEYTNYRYESKNNNEHLYPDHIYNLHHTTDYLGHAVSPAIDFTIVTRGKLSYTAGVRYLYTYRNNDKKIEETGEPDMLKPDNTNESIYAAYGNIMGRFGDFYIKAGLRIEYCDGVYRYAGGQQSSLREWAFLPSVALQYTQNSRLGHSLSLNYSARTLRPSAAYLDPTEYKNNEFLYLSGNPDIKSTYIHSLQLRQTLWNELTILLSADWQNNNIETAFTLSPTDSRIYHYKPINYGYSSKYKLNVFYGKRLFSIWYLNASAGVGLLKEKTYNYGLLHSLSYDFNLYNQIMLPHDWNINISGSFNHFGRQGGRQLHDSYHLSASVSKGFFNNKLSLTLSLQNIIYNEMPETIYYMDQYILYQYNDFTKRNISLSIRYRFDIGKKEINSQQVYTSGVSKSRF